QEEFLMYDTWQQVDLRTSWGVFAPGAVLFYTDDDAVVVEAIAKEKKAKLRIQRLNGERFEKELKQHESMGLQAEARLESRQVRGMMLPAVLWEEDALFSLRNGVGLVTSIVVTLAALWLISSGSTPGAFIYWALMAGAGAGVWARRQVKSTHISFLAPDRLGLTMDTILPYALTREQGKLWISPKRGANRRQLAHERVEAIRDAYLALREDVAYRIESSALFDPKVPATAEFEASLVAFDDVTDDTSTDQLDALASEVEVTFNVAQANAERLGLQHLPEDKRAEARRAGKAAHLAAGAATEGERRASLAQVKRILDSLALYYLPTIDEKLAIGGAAPSTGAESGTQSR
ncbi:MAG: hypothetical protein Q4F67_17690, partial [Propionibacteriaceae bacterium]|nr:hypothetical protein [Propionibacteriaceae bacterium]